MRPSIVGLLVLLVLPTAVSCNGAALFSPRLLGFDRAPLDFGEVEVGESTEVELRATNLHSGPMRILRATLSGSEVDAFALVDGGELVAALELNLELEAGESFMLGLRFEATSVAHHEAVLRVDFAAASSGWGCAGSGTGETVTSQGLGLRASGIVGGVVDPEDCTDGIDNDGDGRIDCGDPDCDLHPACQAEADCANGVDDDGDGWTDCDDPDCAGDASCQPETDCANGIDDDGDGRIDCEDRDCTSDPACASGPEICDNRRDDDGDGLVDCSDPDCARDPACTGGVEQCGNGLDDDGDGLVDCGDPDCALDPRCLGGAEDCTNGIDDDGDGLVDCADIDCLRDPNCLPMFEICDDGADNDGDGLVDCNDPDCQGHPACVGPGEDCGNGVDDDNDRWVDCEDLDCGGWVGPSGSQECPSYLFTSRADRPTDFGLTATAGHTSQVDWELGFPVSVGGTGPFLPFDGAFVWCTGCVALPEWTGRFFQGLVLGAGPQDLSAYASGSLELRFWSWMSGEVDPAADQAFVIIQAGALGSPQIVWGPETSESLGWTPVSIDVGALLGQSWARVELLYDSVDSVDANDGWFVDVVELRWMP
jgi:hypothetical protein